MELRPQPRPDAIFTVTDDNGAVSREPIFFLSREAMCRLLDDMAKVDDPSDPADEWKRA